MVPGSPEFLFDVRIQGGDYVHISGAGTWTTGDYKWADTTIITIAIIAMIMLMITAEKHMIIC